MLLLLLPAVALAAAVAYGTGGRRVALAVGITGVVLLVMGTVAIGVVELRTDSESGEAAPADLAPDPRDEGHDTLTDPPLRQPDLVLAAPGDAFDVADPIGPLSDGDVRLVEVRVDVGDQVEGEQRLSLHQCAAVGLTAERCAEGVQAGKATDDAPTVLVELDRRVTTAEGSVDCAEEACVLAVFVGATPMFDVPLLFEADTPGQAQVTVTPARDLRPGQEVTVSVDGLPPRTTGTVTFCAAAEDATRPRCQDADAHPIVAGTGGRATTTVPLARCPRVERCAVQVAAGAAPPAYAELAYASPPGPDLDPPRVGAGLTVAGVLLLAATVLVRRGDWSPPGGDPFAGMDVAHDDPFAGIDLSVDPDDA